MLGRRDPFGLPQPFRNELTRSLGECLREFGFVFFPEDRGEYPAGAVTCVCILNSAASNPVLTCPWPQLCKSSTSALVRVLFNSEYSFGTGSALLPTGLGRNHVNCCHHVGELCCSVLAAAVHSFGGCVATSVVRYSYLEAKISGQTWISSVVILWDNFLKNSWPAEHLSPSRLYKLRPPCTRGVSISFAERGAVERV